VDVYSICTGLFCFLYTASLLWFLSCAFLFFLVSFLFSCVFSFRHGARPVSTFFGLFAGHEPLCVNRRDAACRVSPAKINKQMRGNTIFLEMDLCTIFDFFLCLSLPTRGTPRLYEIQHTAFIQKYIFGLSAHHKPFWEP
jgi:hypothetical protein